MADGVSFDGVNGSTRGESPASAPTPHEGVKSNGNSGLREGFPRINLQPASTPTSSPAGNPASNQLTSGDPPPNQPAEPTAQSGANSLVEQLRQRGHDPGENVSDEDLLNDISEFFSVRDNLPSPQQIQQFQQVQPLLQQFQSQQGEFLQYLADKAKPQNKEISSDQGGESTSSADQRPPVSLESLQSLKVDGPLKFEPPEPNEMAIFARDRGLVKADINGIYHPVKGEESNQMAVMAANNLNERAAYEAKFFDGLRNNAPDFIQRAMAEKWNALIDNLGELLQGSTKQFTEFQSEIQQDQALSSVDQYFRENLKDYYELDDKGLPRRDRNGQYVQTELGNAYAQISANLEEKIPDVNERHERTLQVLEGIKGAFAPKPAASPQQPPQAQQSSPTQQAPVTQQPASPHQQQSSRSNRRVSFMDHANRLAMQQPSQSSDSVPPNVSTPMRNKKLSDYAFAAN